MTLDLRFVRYGPESFQSLADAVAVAKQGDPLGLVTVVVPRGTVGLAARRRLAGTPPGILNVRHLTLSRLAADLAVPGLAVAGKRPLTPALEHEAVRVALEGRRAGVLAAVKDQPATIRAISRTARELQGASSRTLDALAAQSARAAEVVAVVRAVREQLRDHFGDSELLAAAAAEVVRAPEAVAAATGPVVVHLPDHVGSAEVDLLDRLAAVVPVSVLVGLTDEPTADVPARELAELMGRSAGKPPAERSTPSTPSTPRGARGGSPPHRLAPTEPTRPAATEIWSAASADAEVLLAIRRLLTLHAAGRPLERMALLHSGRDPYPRLVHDALARAGVPFNGPGPRPLSATVAGRALLGYLELPDHDWRRDDVMAWLATAPVLHDGREVPVTQWDLLSREARVIGGVAEWRDRLAAHAALLRRRARWFAHHEPGTDDDTANAPRAPMLEEDARACEELWRFVDGLLRRTVTVPDRWEGWGRWCRRLLDDMIGGPGRRADWPTAEVVAFEALAGVLAGLSGLDHLGRRPSLADVRAALQIELEAAAPQTSRFGRGITCGQVADAVGLDIDVVWVLGMVDGAFPAPADDDVLIPDREREAAASTAEVPRRATRRAAAERDLLATLAGAEVRILSYPVGDQRRGGGLRPARPLLDALGELVGGRRLYARDLPLPADVTRATTGYHPVPSFAAAVSSPGAPVSIADWDLRAFAAWVVSGHRPDDHFLAASDAVLGRGLALRHGRRGRRMSRFDGRVDAEPGAATTIEATQSVTALEHYAQCPRRYLLGSVLDLTVREKPEAALRISALDRGIAVHRVLERFIAAEMSGPEADGALHEDGALHGDGAAEELLSRITAAVLDELEDQRLTGPAALWEIDRMAISNSLRRFLERDRAHRDTLEAVPEAVEQRFGDDGMPVVVDLGGGRRIAFRGRIDRIDRTADGGLSVIDYKSGKSHHSDGPLDDPLAGGTRLQLAVYGLAARQRYRPEGTVMASYWFLGAGGAVAWCRVTEELEADLAATLRGVVDSIEAGVFPARPGAPDHRSAGEHCATCPFDAVCPSDRQREWERKRTDPWLSGFLALAEREA